MIIANGKPVRRPKAPKELVARYRRALQALKLVAEELGEVAYPEAYVKALITLAPRLRPATWCEYRRAAVLDCRNASMETAAERIQSLKQSDHTKARPKRAKRRTITMDEMRLLVEKANSKGDKALVLALQLAWRYGLRAAEMPNLQMDGTYLSIRGAKRTNNRSSDRKIEIQAKDVPAMTKAVALLAGETSVTLRAKLYRLCESAMPGQMGITFHRIRHQVASNLKFSEVDVISIAKLLGHRSCKSTGLYGDPRRGRDRRGVPPVLSEFEPRPAAEMPHRKRGPAPK